MTYIKAQKADNTAVSDKRISQSQTTENQAEKKLLYQSVIRLRFSYLRQHASVVALSAFFLTMADMTAAQAIAENMVEAGKTIFAKVSADRKDRLYKIGTGSISSLDFGDAFALSSAQAGDFNIGANDHVEIRSTTDPILLNYDAINFGTDSVDGTDRSLTLNAVGGRVPVTFTGKFVGKGTVVLSRSTIVFDTKIDNSSFSGIWDIGDNSSLTAVDISQFGTADIRLNSNGAFIFSNSDFSGIANIENKLVGAGGFSVVLNSAATVNLNAVTSEFTGALELYGGQFTLGGNNQKTVEQAMLFISAMDAQQTSTVIVGAGRQVVRNVALNGGILAFKASIGNTMADGYIETDELDLSGGIVSIQTGEAVVIDNDLASGSENLLRIDNTYQYTQLVKAGVVIGGVDGSIIQSWDGFNEKRAIKENGETVADAEFSYELVGGREGGPVDGLYVKTRLARVILADSKILTLKADEQAAGEDAVFFAEITGAGNLAIDAGNAADRIITLNHTNSYTGSTIIKAGSTLRFGAGQALGATGSLVVNDTATVDFGNYEQILRAGQVNGALQGNGGRLVFVGGHGDFVINSANSGLDTSVEINGGSTVRLTNAEGFGASRVLLDGSLDFEIASVGDATFDNVLTGRGVLTVALGDAQSSFYLGEKVGDGFGGTLVLGKSRFFLGGNNAVALANATLQIGANNITTVMRTEATERIHGLTLGGGELRFDGIEYPSGLVETPLIEVDDLTLLAGTVTDIRVNKAQWVWDVPPPEEIQARSILDQDNASIALVKAKNIVNQSADAVHLIDQDGNDFLDEERREIAVKNKDSNEVVATGTYGWGFSFQGESEADKGLYIGYSLQQVAIHEGKTLTFEPGQGAIGQSTVFSARIVDKDTGSGTLKIIAASAGNGGVVTLDNDSNAFTANVDIVSGTLRLGSNHALGQNDKYTKGVALLSAGTVLDLNGKTQTIGSLATVLGSAVILSGGHLAIAGGGRSEGLFKGAGQLDFSGGNFIIDNDNAELTAGIAIDRIAEVTLGDVGGLGTGEAVRNSGKLVFAGADGVLTRAVDGSGTVALTDGANIELGVINGISSTWSLAAGTTLTASAEGQLGTAAIENDGTFVAVADNSADWVLGNTFSGSGAFIKNGAGALTIKTANAGHIGATTVADGVLVLGHKDAVGTSGVVTINAGTGLRLDFAVDADFKKQLDGFGSTEIAGGEDVVTTIAADNSGYEGAWSVTGHGRITAGGNLGKGEVAISETGRLDVITAGDVRFDNVLKGKGVLYASNGGGAFDFGRQASSFEGTLWLEGNTFRLDGDNTKALTGAILRTGSGNITTVGRNSQKIGGLVIDSGSRLVFGDTFIPGSKVAENVIETGALEIKGVASIQANVRDKIMNPSPAEGLEADNILSQDDGTQELQFIKLAEGQTVVGSASQLKLLDENGEEVDFSSGDVDRDIVDANGRVAKGRYGLDFGTGKDNDGLYVSYKLKELDIQDGKTLVLRPDDNASAGGVKLDARLTGSGNLEVNANAKAGNVVIIANAGNDYTGTTVISNGVLQMESDNALGQTSHLTINAGTRLHINGDYRQTLRGLDAKGDNTLSGGGELVFAKDVAGGSGIFTIDGRNGNLAANVTIETGAQAVLRQTSGLGIGGKVILGEGATLTFAGAKGQLQKSIFGEGGIVALTEEADLILMAQGTFNGSWDVREKARLTATADNQLGEGEVNLAGDATLRVDSAMDWVFDNRIVTTDDTAHFVKDGAGYLTVNDVLADFKGDIAVNGGALIVDSGADADRVAVSAKHVTIAKDGILSGRGLVDSTVTNYGVIAAWDALDTVQADGEQGPPAGTLHFTKGLRNLGTLLLSGDDVGNWITITGGLQAGEGSKLVISIAAGSNGLLDDDAQKDMLILDGGTVTGETLVTVLARDGQDMQTTEGILVVRVDNGAVVKNDAFRLDRNAANYRKETNTLRFGAYDYEYRLVRKTVDDQDGWHLVAGGIDDGNENNAIKRWISPEAAVASGLQSANRNMFMMRMSDHEGRQLVMTQGRDSRRVWSMWGRFDGGYRTFGFAGGTGLRRNSYLGRFGVDLAGFDFGGRGSLYTGVMGGWGYDKFSANRGVASAEGRSNGYNGGIYATWYSNDREQKQGGYVDGWLQYGYYDNEAKGAGSFKAHSWTGSIEAGYQFWLFGNDSSEFYITPQAQLAYIQYDTSRFHNANPFMDLLGIKVRFGDDDGLAGRVGMRFHGKTMLRNDVILKPFGALDWHYDQKPGRVYFGSDIISSAVPRNIGEVSFGVETDITQNLQVWGQGSASFGKNDYEAYKGSLGMKVKW